MSLKSFHLFFIATALGMLAYTTYWSGARVLEGEDHGLMTMGVLSAAAFAAGVPYLVWFYKKSRTLR